MEVRTIIDQVEIPTLTLQAGSVLAPVAIAYECWGELNAAADNVILLCHALTGDAHAYDTLDSDNPQAGWWNPLIGPGRTFDTDRYFVVCSNVLGSCYGSTGPASPYPEDGQPYRLRFPMISIGDMVQAQYQLLQQLGIRHLVAVVGGSIGGLQALEWSIAYPDFMDRTIIIAAAARLSAQGVAIDDIARQAIMGDPAWQQGDYDLDQPPATGLGIARMVAMLTYTSPTVLQHRFGRNAATRPSSWPNFGPRFDVETYFQHQADKLVRRFDANAYLYLTQAMDQYDAAKGAGRGSDLLAYARIHAHVLTVGITSDWLYPPEQVQELAQSIVAAGGTARYAAIHSPNGHDAFLQEWTQLDIIIRPFLTAVPHSQVAVLEM